MYIIEFCSLVLPCSYLAFHSSLGAMQYGCNPYFIMIEISSWLALAFRRERLWQTLANKMKGFLLIDLGPAAIDDALDLKRLLADRHRQRR